MFDLTKEESLAFAKSLVLHIQNYKRSPKDRPGWTSGNLNAIRSFAEARYPNVKSYLARKHARDGEMKDGEYLTFDYAAYIPNEGFLIFAESEFDNNSNESLQGDFEKLLYVRSACKVMMAWVSDSVHAERVAADLSKYARSVCREFSAGEVYVLYFSNWGSDMEEAVYYWQAPGDVNSCRAMNFQFDALSAMDA